MLKWIKSFSMTVVLLMFALTSSAGAEASFEGRIVRGNPAAPITIVEYTDFQCPYCSNGARTLSAMMEKYEGKIKVIVKHYPLPFHQAALPAALYFEGIAAQSPEKAWQYYDALFANSQQLEGGEEALNKLAADLGVDMEQLGKDVRSSETFSKIAADKKEFEGAGYDGVPVFVINGTVLIGAHPPEKFIEIIDAALK